MELEGPPWSSIPSSGNSLSFPLNDVIICSGSMFCPVLQFLSDYGCQTHLWTPAFVLARRTCISYLDFKKYNIQYPFLMIPKVHHLVMNIESVCLWLQLHALPLQYISQCSSPEKGVVSGQGWLSGGRRGIRTALNLWPAPIAMLTATARGCVLAKQGHASVPRLLSGPCAIKVQTSRCRNCLYNTRRLGKPEQNKRPWNVTQSS